MPCFSMARYAATETVRMAGCVFSVSLSSSSGPSKQSFDKGKSSALSASANTALDSGKFSARSRPMPGYCEACPGNRNASLLILAVIPRRLTARGERGYSGQLLFDFLVYSRAAKFGGHSNCVLYGIGIRAAVADDGDSPDSEQRRPAVFGIIGAFAELVESALGESISQLGRQAAFNRFFQHAAEMLHHSLADLQSDISDEAVADDHVHVSAKNVAAFHVADKIEGRLLQE